jgi:hypothetical protein
LAYLRKASLSIESSAARSLHEPAGGLTIRIKCGSNPDETVAFFHAVMSQYLLKNF